jgi:hypothetical protein
MLFLVRADFFEKSQRLHSSRHYQQQVSAFSQEVTATHSLVDQLCSLAADSSALEQMSESFGPTK